MNQRNELQEWFDAGSSRSWVRVSAKAKGAHLDRGNDETLCGRLAVTDGWTRLDRGDVFAEGLTPCGSCWKIMEAEVHAAEADVEAQWDALQARVDVDQDALSSADQNADDTAREEGFERHSDQWYRVALSTYAYWVDQHEGERQRAAEEAADTTSSREEESLTQTTDSGNVPSCNTNTENQGENTMAANTNTKPSAAEIKADVEAALEALATADSTEKVDGLEAQVTDLLKGLRANQRVGFQMRLKEAVSAAKDRLKEETKSTAVVVKASTDWTDMEGGEEEARKLMDAGVERIRQGAEIGLKAADLFKEVANVIFVGRLKLRNKQGLPDITAKSQGARNLASEMFKEAKAGISEDQVDLLEFHASLAKGTQNRMTDVTVEFLRNLATLPQEEAAKLFPFLADMELGASSPEDAVRAVYAENGISLPTETRAELAARKREEAKALESGSSSSGDSEGEGEGEGSEEAQEDAHSPKENKLLAAADKLAAEAGKLAKGTSGLSDDVKAELKAKVDAALAELAKASAALAG